MKPLSIVIPLYTTDLSDNEWISLERCFSLVGSKYDVTLVTPEGFDCSIFAQRLKATFSQVTFERSLFEGLKGYNRLMLSYEFYNAFASYRYILIYQCDCYLFSDELEQWCQRGYDYVGAPWIAKPKYSRWYYKLFIRIRSIGSSLFNTSDYSQLLYKVGNGGLSLRRVAKFREVTEAHREIIDRYVANCHRNIFNEDVFWGIEAPKLSVMKIPSWSEALKFSFDAHPEECFRLNGEELPMGCHGWCKDSMLEFWRGKF